MVRKQTVLVSAEVLLEAVQLLVVGHVANHFENAEKAFEVDSFGLAVVWAWSDVDAVEVE